MNIDGISDITKTIEDIVDKNQLDDILTSYELIRDEVYHMDLYKGWSKSHIQASILLAACRLENVPISPMKISETFNISVRELLLSYRSICDDIDFLSVLPVKWTAYLKQYSDVLNLEDSTVALAFDIGHSGEFDGLASGRKPRSYAASSIYAAVQDGNSADDWLTQRRLSEESDISENTIRNTYKALLSAYNN